MPKEELKSLLSNTLELTPQAADIKIEPDRRENANNHKEELNEVRIAFSRASQKELSEIAAERSSAPSQEKLKANDRQISL